MVSQYVEETFGPNVTDILCRGSRVITARIPAQVRAQLRAAVKAGVLGHLPKDGLKPEMFYNPDHKHGAIERQKREAEYAVQCIAGVVAVKPVDQRIDEATASRGPVIHITFTVRNDNPDTIWNRLAERLGREPTDAEATAEVRRILEEARDERLEQGNRDRRVRASWAGR